VTLLDRVAESALGPAEAFQYRCFTRWTLPLLTAWRRVEAAAFRRELRYSRRELRERVRFEGFQGLVIFEQRRAAAVMLVYQGSGPEVLYFDTLAVRKSGTGLGGRLMKGLLDEAGKAGFLRVELDTEMVNEKGLELVSLYRSRHGFEVVSADEESGNISMACDLRKRPQVAGYSAGSIR
jgi:hypothetical protein